MRGSTPGLPILTCHRVGLPPPASTCRGLFTSPGALEAQLRLLRRHDARATLFARFTPAALRGFA